MADQEKHVNLFIPCEMDMFSSPVAISTVKVLENLGLEVHYHSEQTCCGRKFFLSGESECAKDLGIKMMAEYDNSDYPLVIPSAACAGFIRKYYAQLLGNVSVVNDLKNFISNTYELCDYIVNRLNIQKLNNKFHQRVFYFKSCGARNLYSGHDAAEILLNSTEGLELLTDPEMIDCCSANGRFSALNPELSEKLLDRTISKIYSTGARCITSTDIHCLQHIDAFIQSKGINIEVIHIADILNAQD